MVVKTKEGKIEAVVVEAAVVGIFDAACRLLSISNVAASVAVLKFANPSRRSASSGWRL